MSWTPDSYFGIPRDFPKVRVLFHSLCFCRDFSSWCFPGAVYNFFNVFFLCRCCWKKKTKLRGDHGLALAQSPGNGNSNSVYIFFPISLLLRFPWRSSVDPFPPLWRGTFGSFQHSCTGNPMSLETNLYIIFPVLRYLFVRVSVHSAHRGSIWDSWAV